MNRFFALAFVLLAGLVSGGMTRPIAQKGENAFEVSRKSMLDRPREMFYDLDGCDMDYYPWGHPDWVKLPPTVDRFLSIWTKDVAGRRVAAVTRCVTGSFGNTTVPKAGNFWTDSWNKHHPNGYYNAAATFATMGRDALEMTCEWCHANGKESWLCIRFNDNHDASGTWQEPAPNFSKFKRENPDCLMGMTPDDLPKHGGWSEVDFGKERVRAEQLKFMREFFENYDIDGVLYDFMRHPYLFRSVTRGGVASQEELDIMTAHMLALRNVSEEVGRKRGRPILVAIRVPDSIGFCRGIGIDLDKWLASGVCDMLVGGSYFQLEPWRVSVDLAHRYGLRFYASIDESRMSSLKNALQLPGRSDVASYVAQASAAMAEGCDGVFWFNIEYFRPEIKLALLDLDLHDLDGLEKKYFAVYRGGGGYVWRYFLSDSDSYLKTPKLSPFLRPKVESGERFTFNLSVGDDFCIWHEKGIVPRLTAKLLSSATEPDDIELCINGHRVDLSSDKDVLVASIRKDWIRKGDNLVSICPKKAVVLNDFLLHVQIQK